MRNIKWTIFLLLVILLGSVGCTSKDKGEQLSQEDSVSIEDARGMWVEQGEELTPEGLKSLLLEAVAIELKTIDNQTVGRIERQEEIVDLVEEIFQHPVQQEYTSKRGAGEVVGPLNFYFLNQGDIYGLMREDLIYIEGYYFLLNAQKVASLEKRFEGNLVRGPITSE